MVSAAQSPYRDIAKKLNMVDVWDQRSLSELSESDRKNRVAYTDSGVIGSFSMDLSGYLMCVSNFENASHVADSVYGHARIILVDASLPSSTSQALDVAFMDKAYRDGTAKMHIIREYPLNAKEKLRLSFVCNDAQRYFETSIKRIQ